MCGKTDPKDLSKEQIKVVNDFETLILEKLKVKAPLNIGVDFVESKKNCKNCATCSCSTKVSKW